MAQTKLQIDSEDYEFIKETHKQLNYKSLSEYIRQAVKEKIRTDQKKLRELKREEAMEMIGQGVYENLFDSFDGEEFENR
jgi:Arc/MetJ-type ribon-helix-helix transcriptional regulator